MASSGGPPALERPPCTVNAGRLGLLNGEVLWFANGWNNSSVYRITGWDDWERATGKVRIK